MIQRINRHTCVDIGIQNYKNRDERGYLVDQADHTSLDNILYIADCGYESYNVLAHIINSDNKFLIQCKDIHSNQSLA